MHLILAVPMLVQVLRNLKSALVSLTVGDHTTEVKFAACLGAVMSRYDTFCFIITDSSQPGLYQSHNICDVLLLVGRQTKGVCLPHLLWSQGCAFVFWQDAVCILSQNAVVLAAIIRPPCVSC